ncbi:MAG: coiled-coil domain-containing protein, partial [Planctomycetota bacterium]
DLNEGPVNAAVGGHVTINIQASKPIPPNRAAGGMESRSIGSPRGLGIGDWGLGNPKSELRNPKTSAAGLRVEGPAGEGDGERFVPLVVDPEDPHRLSTQFEVTGNMHFRIELRGVEGFANRGAAQHSILAIPDGPPEVTVLEPKAVTEVTPHGVIPLVVRVKDDFGITRLTLHAEQAGDGEEDYGLRIADCGLRRDSEWPIAIGEWAPPQSTIDPGAPGQSTIDDGVGKIVEYTWNLEPLALSPGDTVVYHAWAADNYPGAGEDGQIGRSASLRLRIISELEFDVRVRDELTLLEKRIRDIALDEAGLLDATRELVEVREGILAPAILAPAGDLSARQARLIRRVHYVASRFAQLGRRMKANLTARPDAPKPIDRAGESLREVAGGPMTRASGALAEMGDRLETGPTAEQQQALLRETLREQEVALDRLHALIRTMSQWGNFEWLVSKTRDLIDRQETIRLRTASLGKTMLGKSVDSLTTTEAAALTRAQRRQEQVATDVEELLSRMGRLLLETREKDPSGGEAIDAALRAARARNVTGRLRAAAEAIALNRTAAAVIDQKAGAEAIRKMLRALRERDRRELAELRKRLQRAEDQVAVLIDQQRALRSATHEAALLTVGVDDEALVSLEQEQHRLGRNTRSVSDELAATDQAAYAARRLCLAEVPMGKAEEHLRDQDPGAATPEQDEALEMLEDALAWLEELARQTEEQNLRRSLAQIREDLQAIRTAQSGVNEGIDELHEAVKARGRIKRFEAREAARLARQQAEVRMLLDEVLPDLLKVPVYEWALRRVADWMDSCRGRLDARRVDEQLVVSAGRIVRELDKLISAIVETESLPVDTEFADAGGEGGGQGSPATSTPVPTVAELFVLKAMQEEINGRTRELYESLDLDAATEQQLRELRFVGEDQAQVRHLTELVTKRARHP